MYKMECMKPSLYSINQEIIPINRSNHPTEIQTQSILHAHGHGHAHSNIQPTQEENQIKGKEGIEQLRWKIDSLSMIGGSESEIPSKSNPILEILSPKSTLTQFDHPPNPIETFGEERSQFIQQSSISSHQSQLNSNSFNPIHHHHHQTQLEEITQSFQKSTQLFQSDLTPIQSFKKFKPLRLHSRLMNQSDPQTHLSNSNSNSNPTSNQDQDLKLNPSNESIQNQFLLPSFSIEEENQKIRFLISNPIPISSPLHHHHHHHYPLNPILTIKGQPISNLIKSNRPPNLSHKRKLSSSIEDDLLDDHPSNRIKISNHSNLPSFNPSSSSHHPSSSNYHLSIPSLAKLRDTLPSSSRRYYHPI
ncbi:hypothetical protein DFH28DRAFT_350550 [Melampsora americana]|nr:hypothetical protein DFH28DRAFT_350550 [Melampsora americana]